MTPDTFQTIEDEAGEAYGISCDQIQADYHRLYDLGVQAGTHAALCDKGVIPYEDFYDEILRMKHITSCMVGKDWSVYWGARDTAYANTMRPEILSIFQEVTA